ncbi:hypothetical protein MKQ68_24455 [Chitinophaga horti]|uniref:Sensor of ECF-type sigma factor n=1 Tax=Chitinophaga horti TaxID=2920382 RepID=A0ABY6J4L3_9BACT|nr:hypothetical protein [Chitinophaga horti]UYQ93239.1 hypothetical protein MKQ68_24455 [Chitinophaga horti]
MKKFYLIWIMAVMLLGHLPAASAQETNKAIQDKVKSLEIAYISKELNLSPDEAQKFWPVYNKYSREIELLIQDRKQRMKVNKQQTRTDRTADDAMDAELGYERKMLDIRTRYKEEFKKVIPPRKVTDFFRSEREFRTMMIRQLKERKENRNMRRQRQ